MFWCATYTLSLNPIQSFRLILTYDRCVMLVSIKAGMCLGDEVVSHLGWS